MKFDGWEKSKNDIGYKPIHDWIEHRPGEPIPEDMEFDGWETSGEDFKPIHFWIHHRPGEPIPEDMKFDGW